MPKSGSSELISSNDKNSFRARFSAYHGFAEADFEKRALRKFMHWPWRMAVPVILKFTPEKLGSDFEIIKLLGESSSYSQLRRNILDLRNDYRCYNDFGWQRRVFRFRLSGRRIMLLARNIWREAEY
jgi:hypothetical protein